MPSELNAELLATYANLDGARNRLSDFQYVRLRRDRARAHREGIRAAYGRGGTPRVTGLETAVTGTPIGAEVMTAADVAELDVLVWALVDGYATHRENCRACQPNPQPGAPYPCPHLREAIDMILDWRHARMLLSKAEALRIEQDVTA